MPDQRKPDDNLDDALNALGDMADGKHEEPTDESTDESTDDSMDHESQEVAETNDAIGQAHQEADDAEDPMGIGGEQIIAGPVPRRSRKPGVTTRTRRGGPTQLARHGVKVCLIIGMLLLVPGLWAIGLLVGLPIPLAGKTGATAMAYLMLLCWPISICLIWGAFHFAKQHAAYDDAQQPPPENA